ACPSCQQPLEHPTAGNSVKCPVCNHRFDVPAVGPAALGETTVPGGRTKGANKKYCHQCGEGIRARAESGPKRGARQPPVHFARYAADDPAIRQAASNKIAAGICAIVVGSLGIHKFILGLTGPGMVMLLVSVLTFGLGSLVMWPIGIIEGIIYLTRSD